MPQILLRQLVVPLDIELQACAVIFQDGSIIANGEDLTARITPDAIEAIAGPAGHCAPGVPLYFENRAVIPNGKDVITRAAPHTIESGSCAAGHRAPGSAVVFEDGSGYPRHTHCCLNCPKLRIEDCWSRWSWNSNCCCI